MKKVINLNGKILFLFKNDIFHIKHHDGVTRCEKKKLLSLIGFSKHHYDSIVGPRFAQLDSDTRVHRLNIYPIDEYTPDFTVKNHCVLMI